MKLKPIILTAFAAITMTLVLDSEAGWLDPTNLRAKTCAKMKNTITRSVCNTSQSPSVTNVVNQVSNPDDPVQVGKLSNYLKSFAKKGKQVSKISKRRFAISATKYTKSASDDNSVSDNITVIMLPDNTWVASDGSQGGYADTGSALVLSGTNESDNSANATVLNYIGTDSGTSSDTQVRSLRDESQSDNPVILGGNQQTWSVDAPTSTQYVEGVIAVVTNPSIGDADLSDDSTTDTLQ